MTVIGGWRHTLLATSIGLFGSLLRVGSSFSTDWLHTWARPGTVSGPSGTVQPYGVEPSVEADMSDPQARWTHT